MLTGGHGVRMRYDYRHDTAGSDSGVSTTSPRWLRLTRSGQTITGYESADGERWSKVGTTRLSGLSRTVRVGLLFLELRHKVEIHRMTGRVIECPIDEMNRPRGAKDAALRIPPSGPEVKTLFAGWGGELATCRKFAPTARPTRVGGRIGGRGTVAVPAAVAGDLPGDGRRRSAQPPGQLPGRFSGGDAAGYLLALAAGQLPW